MLYFVATPIGNLKDISHRAIQTLNDCDIIFCEDTRVSSVLLSHYGISKPLYSYHKFNENEASENIIKLCNEGKNICIVSDSGCPIISDPGLILAKKLHRNDIKYSVIPGANACISALMLSGFDSHHFTFLGFLPEKNTDRAKLLENVQNFNGSLIFYISPHSLKKDILSISKALGNRKACLVKEITKIYESVVFFSLEDQLDIVAKGEFVLIVEGCYDEPKFEFDLDTVKNEYAQFLLKGETENKAISKISKKYNKARNEIYQIFKGKN